MSKSKLVKVLNALCGAGKTYTYCNNIIDSNHPFHIVSVPSIELQNEIANKYFEGKINYTIINSELNPEVVTKTLIDYCVNKQDVKHVIIITHATLHGMNDISSFNDYHLHLDEIPDHLIQRWTIEMDWNHNHDKYFNVINAIVSLKDEVLNDEFKNITLKHSKLGQMLDALKSDRTRFYHTSSKDMQEGVNIEEYVQVFTPNWFPNNTTIYTADGEISIAIKLIKDFYNEIECVMETLDSDRTGNYLSDKINYNYFMNGRNNSKNVYVNQQQPYYEGLKLCFEMTNDESTIMLLNKDIEKKRNLIIPSNVKLLPHNLHGINAYDTVTNIILQASTNRTPTEETFLKDTFGLTKEDIFNDRLAKLHQAVMRTALRRPDFNGTVNVYGVDLRTGEALKQFFFKNMKIEKIGNIIFDKSNQGKRGKSKIVVALTKKEDNTIYKIKTNAAKGLYSPIVCAKVLHYKATKQPRKILEMYNNGELK